jgi:biotin operon repressor
MSPVPTVEVEPCPLKVPADLLALAPDTAVPALRHWFDFAIEETTNVGQLKSEIEQRIKDQTAGLFSIDEAACIAADAIGADRKKTRQAIWKAIDDGALVPLWDKARTPLPLPLTGTDKSLALIRTDELANVFEAWPLKREPQPAPAKATPPTGQERQAERWQKCIDAGLTMPTDTYGRYPRGIGKVAKTIGISRQSLRDDLNKYRERVFSKTTR